MRRTVDTREEIGKIDNLDRYYKSIYSNDVCQLEGFLLKHRSLHPEILNYTYGSRSSTDCWCQTGAYIAYYTKQTISYGGGLFACTQAITLTGVTALSYFFGLGTPAGALMKTGNTSLKGTMENCTNWTPLHWAASRGAKDTAKYLYDHGADTSIRAPDENGMTFLDLARKLKHNNFIRYFETLMQSKIADKSTEVENKNLELSNINAELHQALIQQRETSKQFESRLNHIVSELDQSAINASGDAIAPQKLIQVNQRKLFAFTRALFQQPENKAIRINWLTHKQNTDVRYTTCEQKYIDFLCKALNKCGLYNYCSTNKSGENFISVNLSKVFQCDKPQAPSVSSNASKNTNCTSTLFTSSRTVKSSPSEHGLRHCTRPF